MHGCTGMVECTYFTCRIEEYVMGFVEANGFVSGYKCSMLFRGICLTVCISRACDYGIFKGRACVRWYAIWACGRDWQFYGRRYIYCRNVSRGIFKCSLSFWASRACLVIRVALSGVLISDSCGRTREAGVITAACTIAPLLRRQLMELDKIISCVWSRTWTRDVELVYYRAGYVCGK
jgi:hypothetical protein